MRYYISSAVLSAEKALHGSKSHWQIENKLHWVLDVVLLEDQSRVRKDHAPENMAIIRRISLNALNKFKNDHKLNISIIRIQNKLTWNQN